MGNEFSQGLEQDTNLLQEKREKFNRGIQTLANLLEERRREADGANIDTEKLDVLTKQIESFIAQLNGNGTEIPTGGQREPSPFDDDYKEKMAARVVLPSEQADNLRQTSAPKQETASNSNPFA